jgi:hypothetical protein
MIDKRWPGAKCIVAATGPSLTPAVAERCQAAAATHKIVAVNDAYKLLPAADLLYGMDANWWTLHNGVPGFAGEKWTAREVSPHRIAEKDAAIQKYSLLSVPGDWAEAAGFSFNPERIHYGANSGFQAINLAILFGVAEVILVGFDMRAVNGQQHFFGNHPKPLNNPNQYDTFIQSFNAAARTLPSTVRIINATPASALTCFPMLELEACL